MEFIAASRKLNSNFRFRVVTSSSDQISLFTKPYGEAGGRGLGSDVQVVSEREQDTYQFTNPATLIITDQSIKLPDGSSIYHSGEYQNGSKIIYGDGHVELEHVIMAGINLILEERFKPNQTFKAESESELTGLELLIYTIETAARAELRTKAAA